MKSRGFIYELGAGARKSLVLLWTAVLVCSLLLQYVGRRPHRRRPSPPAACWRGRSRASRSMVTCTSGNAASNPGNIPAGLYAGLPTPRTGWTATGSTASSIRRTRRSRSSSATTVDTASVTGDSAPDTSAYVGGNKEDDTRDWGYFNSAGPNDKTDYRHVMAGVKVSGGNPYVFLGAERIDTNGSMVVDFELNQKPFKVFPGAPGVAKPDRSVNDLLISLEYANGGSNPEVTLYRVSAVQEFNTGQTVTFSKISDANDDRRRPVGDQLRGAGERRLPVGDLRPCAAFAWAEASVNIAALDLPVTCLNFGQGSIRSRTGGAPMPRSSRTPASPSRCRSTPAAR